MKILFNLFGTGCRAPLVLIKYLVVGTWVPEPEVNGARERFPHLPSKSIRETDLDQPGTLGIP